MAGAYGDRMAAVVQTFCIGCAKHAVGDRLGQLFAIVCTAPYFAVYHCAVVVHARRELHVLSLFLGMLVNAAASMVVKRLVRQPRPEMACAVLGKCGGHGWPSSHTQTMAFAFIACLLLYLHRRRVAAMAANGKRRKSGQPRGALAAVGPAVQLLELALLGLATAGVAAGRVYLGYHSADQVAAAAVIGAALAWAWWRATLWLSKTAYPQVLRLLKRLGMGWCDTLGHAQRHEAVD